MARRSERMCIYQLRAANRSLRASERTVRVHDRQVRRSTAQR
jgi:hypothetical protein